MIFSVNVTKSHSVNNKQAPSNTAQKNEFEKLFFENKIN